MSMTSIKHGVYGGLAGGVVFGAMMAMMGMLPMIGNMVGVPSPWVGFVVHMMISATIGGSFAVLLTAGGLGGGVGSGLAYGFGWWVLGPLTLMPFFMGMGLGVNWNVAAMGQAMPSLVGHLLFGAILGVTYQWLQHRAGAADVRAPATPRPPDRSADDGRGEEGPRFCRRSFRDTLTVSEITGTPSGGLALQERCHGFSFHLERAP